MEYLGTPRNPEEKRTNFSVPLSQSKSCNLRVAIYARVSTEHEAQISALRNQVTWFEDYLATHHPNWHAVKNYIDEGITGTSAAKRPQFLKMIEDAKAGFFDLILTRETSRFARNTIEALSYARELKRYGVGIFFVNENINSLDPSSDFLFTIMSSLSQQESQKISQRVNAGIETAMKSGKSVYGNGNILGYDRINNEYVINEEQAETVRIIRDLYLNGDGCTKIATTLEQMGRLTATGKTHWHAKTISQVLQNSFYTGLITYRKSYTPDFLEQKRKINYGEKDNIIIEGTHTPIWTKEEFARIQEILESRRQKQPYNPNGQHRPGLGKRDPIDIWTKLLECECGHKFNRKKKEYKNKTYIDYRCYNIIRYGSVQSRLNKGLSIEGICESPTLQRWKLQLCAKEIFKKTLFDADKVVSTTSSILNDYLSDEKSEIKTTLRKKQDELNSNLKSLDILYDMRLEEKITKDIFERKLDFINNKIEKIQTEIQHLLKSENDTSDKVTLEERLRLLQDEVKNDFDFDSNEPVSDSMIESFVEKIVVSKDGLSWYLRGSHAEEYKLDVSNSVTFCCNQDRLQSLRRTHKSLEK